MKFIQLHYLPVLILSYLIILFVFLSFEKKFFKFVRTFWFFRRSRFSFFSTFLYLLALLGLLTSLLDLRGQEERIKTPVPSEKTIILIDTSASMLAEDVKPSRLQKAVLIAKHFARKAAGQQISIVAFAQLHRKIVPFTADLDLIDSRLESLKNLRNHYGSSAVSISIQESFQFFKDREGFNKGNILVLTDGEETSEKIDLNIPKEIKLALVGIGTSKGGRIPLDNDFGLRIDFKKERGRDVITKLNENFFKDLVSNNSQTRYWIASSYTLPSEEILAFFRGFVDSANKKEQDTIIRPVLMEWIVVPSLIILSLSYLLRWTKIFTAVFCFLFYINFSITYAQEVKLTPEILERLDKLKTGVLDENEKIKLADDLYRMGAKEESISIFKENLSQDISSKIPPEAYLNYGTALLETGNLNEGLNIYSNLSKSLEGNPESKKINDIMKKNVLSFFKKQEEKKNQEKKKNEDNKKQSEDEQKSQNDQRSSGNKKSDQKNEKSTDELDQNKSKDKNKQDSENKDESQKQNSKENKNDSQNKSEDEIKKKTMPLKKIPAKLKQLMDDDRKLQMKKIENDTRDLNKRKSEKTKDW